MEDLFHQLVTSLAIIVSMLGTAFLIAYNMKELTYKKITTDLDTSTVIAVTNRW